MDYGSWILDLFYILHGGQWPIKSVSVTLRGGSTLCPEKLKPNPIPSHFIEHFRHLSRLSFHLTARTLSVHGANSSRLRGASTFLYFPISSYFPEKGGEKKTYRRSREMSRGNLICSICYEDLKPAVENLQSISICGHVFHEQCLQRWFIYSSAPTNYNCPLCRKSCGREHAIRLYFQSGEDQCDRKAKDGETKILMDKLSVMSSSFTRDQLKEIKNMMRPQCRGNGRPVGVLPSYRKYEGFGTTSARPGGTEQHAAAVGGCVLPCTSNVEVSNKRKGADPRNSGLDIRNCKGARISKMELQSPILRYK